MHNKNIKGIESKFHEKWDLYIYTICMFFNHLVYVSVNSDFNFEYLILKF
jgi:hypothetical protein